MGILTSKGLSIPKDRSFEIVTSSLLTSLPIGFLLTILIYVFNLFEFEVIYETYRGMEMKERISFLTYLRAYGITLVWVFLFVYIREVSKWAGL